VGCLTRIVAIAYALHPDANAATGTAAAPDASSAPAPSGMALLEAPLGSGATAASRVRNVMDAVLTSHQVKQLVVAVLDIVSNVTAVALSHEVWHLLSVLASSSLQRTAIVIREVSVRLWSLCTHNNSILENADVLIFCLTRLFCCAVCCSCECVWNNTPSTVDCCCFISPPPGGTTR